MEEMLDYLSSYKGLMTLAIRGIMMDCQDQENGAGDRFWQQVVPRHKDSLTRLIIQPCYEGAWCYGPTAAEAILQCLPLYDLAVGTCGMDP